MANGSSLAYYLAPYASYVLILAIPAAIAPQSVTYAAATVASVIAIVVGWRHYLPIGGAQPVVSVVVGVVAGLVGTALWVALKAPFYSAGGTAWPADVFIARLIASSTVVPVFEELLFRGFLLRAVVQWEEARRAGAVDPMGVTLNERSVQDVAPGRWTLASVAVSTMAFAAGHAPGEWLAAVAYGLVMVLLTVTRKDLLTPIVAHAATNASLALWVARRAQWALW